MAMEAVASVEGIVVVAEMSQCIKQLVMNVTRVVKSLSVHQVINQFIALIVLVVKEKMEEMIVVLEREQ